MIRLWDRDRHTLAGVRLGACRDEVLALGGFFEDQGPDGEFLQRFFPTVHVELRGDVVALIAVAEECLLDETNLIGMPIDDALDLLARHDRHPEQDGSETCGAQLLTRDGLVTHVILGDWSKVPNVLGGRRSRRGTTARASA